jgi:hypothetical protein
MIARKMSEVGAAPGIENPAATARVVDIVAAKPDKGITLGVSVHKRRTGARLGRTGPARSAVFAQDAPDKKKDR